MSMDDDIYIIVPAKLERTMLRTIGTLPEGVQVRRGVVGLPGEITQADLDSLKGLLEIEKTRATELEAALSALLSPGPPNEKIIDRRLQDGRILVGTTGSEAAVALLNMDKQLQAFDERNKRLEIENLELISKAATATDESAALRAALLKSEAEVNTAMAERRDEQRDVLGWRAVGAYALSLAITAQAEGETSPVFKKLEELLLKAFRHGTNPEEALEEEPK